MEAFVIPTSSDSSEESVGSHVPRVIIFGAIPAIIHVVPAEVLIVPADPLVALKVAVVSVTSPAGVLDLVDYSSLSVSDPSKDSLPLAPELPLVSPFLCSDDLEVDSESEPAKQRPDRHESLTIHDAMVLRCTSNSSSSGLSADSLLDTSSGPSTRFASPRLVYPPVMTPRYSEAFRRWRSAPLSTPYAPTTSESSDEVSVYTPFQGITRHRRDPSGDDVRDLVTTSGCGQLMRIYNHPHSGGVRITMRCRSITTWEDLTTHFLAQFFLPGRRTIDQSASGKLHDRNAKEYWELLEDLSLYDNESWNDPRDFAKPVKAITLPQDVLSTSDRRIIKLENQVQRLIEAHLALTQPTQVNKITTSYKYVESLELGKNESAFVQGEIPAKIKDPGLFTLPCRLEESEIFDTLDDLGSCVNIIPLYLFKKLKIRLLEETKHIFRLVDRTKSYPVGIVKDVEVHIGKLKLLNDFYMIDMKKDPETPLLAGRGFLATANAVIDCRMAKIAIGEGITWSIFRIKGVDLDCHLLREWEIARDAEFNPFKDTLVFRRMDKPPKDGDGVWHAKIRLINPDGDEFTKTLQSIPTTRKLFERESPKEIIDLDHFYET
nr:MAK10-like protein [Tanacetum cinerariifolium]